MQSSAITKFAPTGATACFYFRTSLAAGLVIFTADALWHLATTHWMMPASSWMACGTRRCWAHRIVNSCRAFWWPVAAHATALPERYEDKYLRKYEKMLAEMPAPEHAGGDFEAEAGTKSKFENYPTNRFVIDATPVGNVVMVRGDGVFEYYSDATVSHRLLDVVARKYVTTYCCPHMLIPTFVEPAPALAPTPVPLPESGSRGAAANRSRAAKPAIKSAINRYMRLGRFADFNPLSAPAPTRLPGCATEPTEYLLGHTEETHSLPDLSAPAVSYAEYKKMCAQAGVSLDADFCSSKYV